MTISAPPWCQYWQNALSVGADWVDRDTVRAAIRHSTTFGTAIDGGAHVGTWVPRLAAMYRRVVAFEPAQENFDFLRSNVSRLPNVVLRQEALGSEPGDARISRVPGRDTNSGQYALSSHGDLVKVSTVDCLGLRDLSLLKLDLEGFELYALLGATNTIRECRPVIVIEEAGWGVLHNVPDRAASAYLLGFGYRPVFYGGQDVVFAHPGGSVTCG